MRVLSFGGGVNSTAALVELVRRSEPPDLVIFADTGGERPDTYAHVELMRSWCRERSIEWADVNAFDRFGTLEQRSLERKELPSLAYGFKGCSDKWKRQPMDRFLRSHKRALGVWDTGGLVERCIGIDAGESHRAVLTEDGRFKYRYPLVEWGMDREGCIAAIRAHGLEVPSKSSCFFCPAMKKREILELQRSNPELLERAIKIESNAVTTTVAGLGRSWSWGAFIKADKAQGRLFPETMDTPCMCEDGKEDV